MEGDSGTADKALYPTLIKNEPSDPEMDLYPGPETETQTSTQEDSKDWVAKLNIQGGMSAGDQRVSSQLNLSTGHVPENRYETGTTLGLAPGVMKESSIPLSEIVEIKKELTDEVNQDNMVQQSAFTTVTIDLNDLDMERNSVELILSQTSALKALTDLEDTVQTVNTSQGLCMVMSATTECTTSDQNLINKKEKKNKLKGPSINSITSSPQQEAKPSEGKKFVCDFCGEAFKKGFLMKHVKETHGGEKPYQCHVCLKTFGMKKHLQRHVQTHTGDRQFNCDLCSKAFYSDFELQKHRRVHTGDKPFQCQSCIKAFNSRHDLQVHERTHTGEKPFKCEFCDAAFHDKRNMIKHRKNHTGDKPFKCNFCTKAFSRGSELQKHLRSHTGEKPFKCDFCEKSFSQKFFLTEHIRIHTGEKPFKCEFCFRGFTQRSNLVSHVRRKHTEKKSLKSDSQNKSMS